MQHSLGFPLTMWLELVGSWGLTAGFGMRPSATSPKAAGPGVLVPCEASVTLFPLCPPQGSPCLNVTKGRKARVGEGKQGRDGEEAGAAGGVLVP